VIRDQLWHVAFRISLTPSMQIVALCELYFASVAACLYPPHTQRERFNLYTGASEKSLCTIFTTHARIQAAQCLQYECLMVLSSWTAGGECGVGSTWQESRHHKARVWDFLNHFPLQTHYRNRFTYTSCRWTGTFRSPCVTLFTFTVTFRLHSVRKIT
jgi:hypothetical protein